MSQSLSFTLRDGQDYMQLWPNQKALYALFPENRVIAATKLGIKVMPPIAIVVTAAFVSFYGVDFLPQALTLGLFFVSLPLQGLMWLGYRSQQPLPPSTRAWYADVHQKMLAEGCRVEAVKSRPRYKELAILLKTAFDELDKVFVKQWL
ncbi:DUF412 domain-containing protein [Aestuariibacter sp. AA17]|uniref:UPF0208 membrane protein YfbV n=1 Tax=Fluctibacter corallii TaxID=2984329 RepID=A0ABT3A6F0_9ALTE|nr:terminus macrodomain insulation protein YfbV [Aestuariibacter sp. AA17]MCV2884264.1 DUF412 domain-containing protein [Aestuariibacter sp. AA17]